MIAERVLRHLAILEAYRRDALEDSHQFFGRVGVELIFDFKPSFEVHNEVPVYLTK